MRDILQGFTVYFDGEDHGIDCEELGVPTPTNVQQEYRGGGMDLAVNQGMAALEALEATFRFSGFPPSVLGRTALGPGKTIMVTARGAVMDTLTGITSAHVVIMQGQFNGHSRDNWQRGEKSGMEITMGGIIAYRYEVDGAIVHDIQAYPPRRVVNGVNQLAEINAILGYNNG
jgi:P2 family phage contractile tail tube protein